MLINYLRLICSDNLTKCDAWSCYSLLSIYYLSSLNGSIKCYLLWLGISLSYLPRRSKLPWRCIYYLSTSHNIIRNPLLSNNLSIKHRIIVLEGGSIVAAYTCDRSDLSDDRLSVKCTPGLRQIIVGYISCSELALRV